MKPISLDYKQINPNADDGVLSYVIVHAMTAPKPSTINPAYKFSINHDVRAAACKTDRPRTGRCPLPYDWARGDQVGIETSQVSIAIGWVSRALLLGYSVSRWDGRELLCGYSIENVRAHVAFLNRPRPVVELDDEIPF